nr:translation initiation factor IF-2-like [Aegilops tauschii subsp. strangulata]
MTHAGTGGGARAIGPGRRPAAALGAGGRAVASRGGGARGRAAGRQAERAAGASKARDARVRCECGPERGQCATAGWRRRPRSGSRRRGGEDTRGRLRMRAGAGDGQRERMSAGETQVAATAARCAGAGRRGWLVSGKATGEPARWCGPGRRGSREGLVGAPPGPWSCAKAGSGRRRGCGAKATSVATGRRGVLGGAASCEARAATMLQGGSSVEGSTTRAAR